MEAQKKRESTTTLQGPRNGAKPPRKAAALPCRATLRARTKAQPPKEKATRAKRVNAATISLRPRRGSVGGVWAHGLTQIKSRWCALGKAVGGRSVGGGRSAVSRALTGLRGASCAPSGARLRSASVGGKLRAKGASPPPSLRSAEPH